MGLKWHWAGTTWGWHSIWHGAGMGQDWCGMAGCGADTAQNILGLAQSAWLSAAQYGIFWHGIAQYSTS